jgi:hypothetical protein
MGCEGVRGKVDAVNAKQGPPKIEGTISFCTQAAPRICTVDAVTWMVSNCSADTQQSAAKSSKVGCRIFPHPQ